MSLSSLKEIAMRSWKAVRIVSIILEKAMAPHSSTVAWKIPWTEELGRLQSMGSLTEGMLCVVL